MPGKDNPPIFGLHPNADLTFRLKQSIEMINTLLDIQPKESSGGGGKSREEEVKDKLEKELLPNLPQDFNPMDVKEKLRTLKGPKGLAESANKAEGMSTIPLNIFLKQEIERF